ncbi:MAG: HAD family hydrolase [Thermostichales cyanobacterium SRBZ-1_bins_19]
MFFSLPQTLLWDFDGTLVDSQPAIMATIRTTLAIHGRPQPRAEEIRAIIGYGLAKGFQLLDPGLPPAMVDRLVDTYRQHYPQADQSTQLYPGALSLLSTIHGLGIPMFLVSNKTQTALEPALERLGIRSFFSQVIGESPGQPLKPDPALFQHRLRPHIPESQNCLLIGDTATDIRFARNIGIPVAWASYGYGDPQECLSLRPDHILPDLESLGGMFQSFTSISTPAGKSSFINASIVFEDG